ncbi:S41 family peptidase [Paraherbaspirillum soli]|uniref:S41 family peptidase n=1 Tax=Paraherbaspirillum soli TaxID=631222 RepID=A0ABW0MAD6_9BURK
MQNNANIDWSAVARQDLDFAHQTIIDAHPGAIDHENPNFKQWLWFGYRHASTLAARAKSREQALAALRYYSVGFKDGHLLVYDPQPSELRRWAGWLVDMRGGDVVVVHAAQDWPVATPPLGARLLSCDQQSVRKILLRDMAPYIDRRVNLEATWSDLARFLTLDLSSIPIAGRKLYRSCVAESADGARHIYSMLWQDGPALCPDVYAAQAPSPQIIGLGEGRYWIHVTQFRPDQAQYQAWRQMLEQVRMLRDAKLVVFDTRGNKGGNSALGQELLGALLGHGRRPDGPQQQAIALWRVSPIAVAATGERMRDVEHAYGEHSATFKSAARLHDDLQQALANQQPWVEQSDVPETSPPPQPVQPFAGKLVLLTDSRCASACLDFADCVLSVPGALHVGLPTSADSVYLDVALVDLPSGLKMMLPLKVWRDRARRNNQPLIPNYRFQGNIDDTQALRRWVLDLGDL